MPPIVLRNRNDSVPVSIWVRMEADLMDPVWFGWILVRIGKGAQVKVERMRVDEGVWVPRRMWFTVSLRIGLVKAIHTEQEATYSNYRPRHADSILASATAASATAASAQ